MITNLFYKSQYGFRKGHSTEFAALELLDKLACKMGKDKIPITIFLDFSKVFDTINHEMLHTKVSYYGVKGLSNNLIHSYLANRKQFVEINNTKSDMLPIGMLFHKVLYWALYYF